MNAQHHCCQKPLAGSLRCPINTPLVFQTAKLPELYFSTGSSNPTRSWNDKVIVQPSGLRMLECPLVLF